jgi:hypothetical protein
MPSFLENCDGRVSKQSVIIRFAAQLPPKFADFSESGRQQGRANDRPGGKID